MLVALILHPTCFGFCEIGSKAVEPIGDVATLIGTTRYSPVGSFGCV